MAKGIWKKTSHPGVRYRLHPTRKHGIQRDRYFAIRYYLNGKRVEEGIGWASEGMTAGEAARIRASLRTAAKQGEGPRTLSEKRKLRDEKDKAKAAKGITLDTYWPTYYDHAKRTKKPTSAEKEESHYRRWLSPLMGSIALRKIGMAEWDMLVKTLDKAGLSPRSKEYITGTLRRILKHAYERRLIAEAPPSGKRVGVTGPGASNRRLRVVSPAEAEAILAELKERDINAWRLTRFTFLTGCRASEAFNLRWRDVDPVRGILTFTETKNRDSRTLPLTPTLQELLGQPGEPEAHVFTKGNNQPFTEAPHPFKHVVNKVLGLNNGRTKRDRITFHSIRHSVATNLARTLNPRDLMEVMGWRTVQMAMRYVHGDHDAQARALIGLEDSTKRKAGKVLDIKRGQSG